MSGASPGPAPAAQLRASNSRLRRSSWRAWPQLKLRRKVPRVDGAFTVQPSTRPAPPARNASASSMQSPPASAEATRVSSLSPRVRAPRRVTEVEVCVRQFTEAEPAGERGGEQQARVVHEAVVVEGDVYPVGVARW